MNMEYAGRITPHHIIVDQFGAEVPEGMIRDEIKDMLSKGQDSIMLEGYHIGVTRDYRKDGHRETVVSIVKHGH